MRVEMQSAAERYKVLVVDDDLALLETVSATMEDRYEVRTTSVPSVALKWLVERDFHVVVSDWQMPGMDGMALFREIQRLARPVACLLMTGRIEQFSAEVSREDRKLLGLIAKPFAPALLFDRVDQLARLASMKRSVQRLRG
jgi:two-component system response regulator GlrR